MVLSIFAGNYTTCAQVLQDSTCLKLIRKDIQCTYNMQFTAATEALLKIQKLYPEHPAGYLLRGLLTYWKNYPLQYNSPARVSLEEDLRQCIRISGKYTHREYEAEYLLTNLCARGMLLKFYDDNSLTLKVIPLATSTYKYLRHSFDLTDECTDLYYYAGAYDYLREAYPKIYPVYRPLSLLFPSGSIENGLKELNHAARNAVVLRAESYILLSIIYVNFENKYPQAIYYNKLLHELYPENVLYLAVYIKNLLLMKYYTDAEKLINTSVKDTKNKFFQAQLLIFRGILLEKKYHEMNLAEQCYKSGIGRISLFGVYGNEYAAYGCFGLSRINDLRGDKYDGKVFREKAQRLGTYKKINFDN